ncbi:MAG: hypothetical protein AB7I79_17335 [Rhizobiaceae bacterium]
MTGTRTVLAGAAFALLFAMGPVSAASGDAIERNIDRVNEQQDSRQDNQQAANPCKGITKASTKKQKRACADFMAQQ